MPILDKTMLADALGEIRERGAEGCGASLHPHEVTLIIDEIDRLRAIEAASSTARLLAEWETAAVELLRETCRPIGCFLSGGVRCDCLWCRARAHIAVLDEYRSADD